MDYGRNVIGNSGLPIEVAASGPPEWIPIGITIDWSLLSALGSDTITSPAENLTVKAGNKYLRYGQVVAQVTAGQTWVLTETGTPTGGTFALAGTRPDTGAFVITGAIAQAAAAADVTAALETAFSGLTVSTSGSAGGPFTVTTPIQNLQLWTNSLTGGTAPTVTVVAGSAVLNQGKWGPFDSTASDGRQTLVAGQCGILNTTTLQNGILGFATQATDHPGTIVGGAVWQNRIIATSGSHSLAAGPTWTELRAAFPRLVFAGGPPIL